MNSSLLAFDKLIESNLSAKYCVKGQLATKDIIGLHFYDPGKVSSFVCFMKDFVGVFKLVSVVIMCLLLVVVFSLKFFFFI